MSTNRNARVARPVQEGKNMYRYLTVVIISLTAQLTTAASMESAAILDLDLRASNRSSASLSAWKGMLAGLSFQGCKFDGVDLYAAVASPQGEIVSEFYRPEDVPKYLKTFEHMTLDNSIADIHRDINIQNRPLPTSSKLSWKKVTEYLPGYLIELMNTQFQDGTNCFSIALFFNGLSRETGFVPDTGFQLILEDHFSQSTSSDADIAVLYQKGKAVHAYVPIGSTGWVLTKNGSGSLQPLRFMRESDLLAYYRTLREGNSLEEGRERFSWERAPMAAPISVVYYNRR